MSNVERKSLPLAIVLNLVIPGAGYFYMGKWFQGTFALLLLPVTYATGFPAILLPFEWLGLNIFMFIDMFILSHKNKAAVAAHTVAVLAANTKQCPSCGERIQKDAVICRYCRSKQVDSNAQLGALIGILGTGQAGITAPPSTKQATRSSGLTSTTIAPSTVRQKQQAEYCSQCGKAIDNPHSRFCANCGAQVDSATVGGEASPSVYPRPAPNHIVGTVSSDNAAAPVAPMGPVAPSSVRVSAAAHVAEATRSVDDSYYGLPLYRRSGFASVLVLLGLIPLVGSVTVIIVCISLITGAIYYRKAAETGELAKWSVANTVAAWLIVFVHVAALGLFGMGVIGTIPSFMQTRRASDVVGGGAALPTVAATTPAVFSKPTEAAAPAALSPEPIPTEAQLAEQWSLGLKYYTADGVERDYEKAEKLFRQAADVGYAQACYSLGAMYARGEGLAVDNLESDKWLTIAIARADSQMTDKERSDMSDVRESVEKQMTSDQTSDARQKAQDWLDAFRHSGTVLRVGSNITPPPAAVRVGGNIKPPTKVKDVKPVYPTLAQSARVDGVVIIEATVGPNGAVQEAKVLRSIPLLDEAALDAVRQWAFTPTLLNGVAVPVIMTVTVSFTLQ